MQLVERREIVARQRAGILAGRAQAVQDPRAQIKAAVVPIDAPAELRGYFLPDGCGTDAAPRCSSVKSNIICRMCLTSSGSVTPWRDFG